MRSLVLLSMAGAGLAACHDDPLRLAAPNPVVPTPPWLAVAGNFTATNLTTLSGGVLHQAVAINDQEQVAGYGAFPSSPGAQRVRCRRPAGPESAV